MDFNLTEEQRLFKEMVRSFVEKEVAPYADEIDEKGEFPWELFRKMGELGFFGLRYPEKYGGSDADLATVCIMVEELSRGSLSVASNALMQAVMGTYILYKCGTEEQRERLLMPAIRGEKIGTLAITEPGAGSDLYVMQTTAVREGDHYIINGTKTWITHATVSDFFTVAAYTDKAKGLKGIDLFLLERGTPGLSAGRDIRKLGARGQQTGELILDNCRVPLENLYGGREGNGFSHLFLTLDQARIATGALSVGLARAAFEASLKYSRERVAFGRPIREFQAIAFKLSDMATSIEAARHLVYYAAWRYDNNLTTPKEAAMAKLFASEMCQRVVDEATRIFGSYGFAMEYPAQRFFRDARFLLYGAGTSEILRNFIGKRLEEE